MLRSDIGDPVEAEKAALGIYQQATRKAFHVVKRTGDETRHIFHVEGDSTDPKRGRSAVPRFLWVAAWLALCWLIAETFAGLLFGQ